MPLRTRSMRLLPALALACAAPALAQSAPARVFPAERFEPGVDVDSVANTSWAAVPAHMEWDAAAWLSYSRNPLFTYGDLGDDVVQQAYVRGGSLVSDRLTLNLTGAVGLFEWLQIGADLPVLLAQAHDDTTVPASDAAALNPMGIGDLRLYPKASILRQRAGAPLDIGFQIPFTLPTGQFADYFGEIGFTATPTVLASYTVDRLHLAANLGTRFRSDESVAYENHAGTEVIYRAGVGYDVDLIPEGTTELELGVAGANELDGFFDTIPARNPVEIMGQVAHPVWGPLDVVLGASVGVVAGNGGPDYRLFAALRADGHAPPDADKDGIVGSDDKCPKEAETANGFEDSDGCPDSADADGDGVADRGDRATDKCPAEAEDKDGFEDDDGCPDLDHDHDGIANDLDKCPMQAEDKDGFEDSDGCDDDDDDADGIPDATDKCPQQAEDKDGFADDDGCPDADNDGDTVLDSADKCMNVAGAVENKGCPDADRDGDSVVDRLDNCPDEKGTAANNGCAQKQKVVLQAGKLEILDKVFFKTGKDVIEARSFALLDNVASVLKNHPEIAKVRVEGHTDNVGDAAKNKDLSSKRAAAVVKYLAGKGVDAARLVGEGFGQDKPVADNATEDGKAKNRRVEFVIVD